MASEPLSEAALGQAWSRLATYRRLLPSLDRKRRQLIAERNKARAASSALEQTREALFRETGETVPMPAMDAIKLDALARVKRVRYRGANVVGVILPVPRSHVGARSFTSLREELDDLELVREGVEAERIALTRDIRLLAAPENRSLLDQALSMTADRETLLAVQGWVPDDRLGEIQDLAHRFELAMLSAPPGPPTSRPLCWRAKRPPKAGSISSPFYQTPAYRGWNPALVVFGSFALFFAMILAEPGYYALLLATATGLLWQRLGAPPAGRRLQPLIVAIIACSFTWGVMVGWIVAMAGGLVPGLGSLE